MPAKQHHRALRTEWREGLSYSVAELDGVTHLFAVAEPRRQGTIEQQTREALRAIQEAMDAEGTSGQIVAQVLFVRDSRQQEVCRRVVRDCCGDQMPATTYVNQPPCSGKLVAVEALAVGRRGQDVEIQRRSEQLAIARHSGAAWIHCAQIEPQTTAPQVYERSLDAFQRMARLLAEHGADYSDVIRTWLYLGDIVGREGQTQRYMELNRARTDFYRDFRFGAQRTAPEVQGTVYPASTGIGASNRDVLMSCIALRTETEQFRLLPLENPHQTSAFDYSCQYGPESPKFCRAMAVLGRRASMIFVSGTASITNSETRWIGDVERQTHQTLDNIEDLIAASNFARYDCPGIGATLEDLALARVYVKHPEDFAATRAVCQSRMGRLPVVYTVADVCRPELLVEIEGIAFTAPAPAEDSAGHAPLAPPHRLPGGASPASGPKIRSRHARRSAEP